MKTKTSFNINTFTSREERHYCTYLYSWLLQSRKNIETFLPKDSPLGKDYQLFYEYTAVREYLYTIKKKLTDKEYKQKKKSLKQQLAQNTKYKSKDIQKKKVDIAIQTQLNGKTMVYLIEAKFEGSFDTVQLDLTENYGKILNDRFDVGYEVILLGLNYHLNKDNLKKYENRKISWEDLNKEIDDPKVKETINDGLKYQYEIHPKTKI